MPNYTIKKVRAIFEAEGCTLGDDEYFTNHTKMKYKCSCGSIAYTTMQAWCKNPNKQCKHCRTMTIYSTEEVEQIFKSKGYTPLFHTYKNNTTKLDCFCLCGEKTTMSLCDIYKGYRCAKCSRMGENNPNYNPNLTDDDRASRRDLDMECKYWSKRIMRRDNWTCCKCKARGGITLNAHHIQNYRDNVDLRYSDDNGALLCRSCHLDFHNEYGYRHNTKEQFKLFMN